MFVYLYLFFEAGALLTSVVCYQQIKKSQFKFFLPYLAFIVVYEVGTFFNWFSIRHSNLWVSNITMALSFLFYSFLLSTLIREMVFKRWLKGLTVLAIVFFFLNEFFIQGFWKLDSMSLLLQFAIIIFANCIYFYELMNTSEASLSIITLPEFWLNTGLLFFCLAQFIFFSAFAYMAYKNNYGYYLLFSIISNIANMILYSSLSVSFLCFRVTKS